ncbi:MAG TPA: hypothetical protein PKV93_14000, partial [Fervidobacterium sp.]|nr:hypothetical protein [Fervidobacterium sp.]
HSPSQRIPPQTQISTYKTFLVLSPDNAGLYLAYCILGQVETRIIFHQQLLAGISMIALLLIMTLVFAFISNMAICDRR